MTQEPEFHASHSPLSVSPGFIDLVSELLAPLGRVTTRAMFGGVGIYVDGYFLALVDDDVLYVKTDAALRHDLAAEASGPFTYMTKHGPGTLMSYWRMPDRLFDEPDEMVAWARRVLAVAVAAKTKVKRPSARGGKSSKR